MTLINGSAACFMTRVLRNSLEYVGLSWPTVLVNELMSNRRAKHMDELIKNANGCIVIESERKWDKALDNQPNGYQSQPFTGTVSPYKTFIKYNAEAYS